MKNQKSRLVKVIGWLICPHFVDRRTCLSLRICAQDNRLG
jgi:hypothetical protein